MRKLKLIDKISNKLAKAFVSNKFIAPVPLKFVKNIKLANQLRVLCERKVNKPVIGFKAGGTAIPVLKKLKEKEPFYASIYKHNLLKSEKKVKINKYTLGIELEVFYIINKSFFNVSKKITLKNLKKYVSHMGPCIEIVGYRQRKKGLKYLGDICSEFGGNVKFIIGRAKKFKNINIGNLKTNISNNSSDESINGNTNTVYINPLNSLKFVLNKIIKDKVKLDQNFYVFTGSTVGVVPILKKAIYNGKIEKLGSVKTKII